MTEPVPGAGALPVRRSYLVETDRLTGVVVEVDPSREPTALAVLQAGLHEQPEGHRLVFGWDVTTAGLGAWVGDQRVRIQVWPALVDAAGTVIEDDHDHPDADVLWIDFDPIADRTALDDLVRVGRLIVAGPDAGPVPLVVDLDGEAVAEALARIVGDPA